MAVKLEVRTRPSGYIAQIIRPNTRRYMTPKVKRATQAVRAEAPQDKQGGGGSLKRSIRMRARDAGGRFASQQGRNPVIVAFEIVAEAPHAMFVIHGTRPHPIRSRGNWPLRNRKTGQVFGPRVFHPGTKPNNFFERGIRKAGF